MLVFPTVSIYKFIFNLIPFPRILKWASCSASKTSLQVYSKPDRIQNSMSGLFGLSLNNFSVFSYLHRKFYAAFLFQNLRFEIRLKISELKLRRSRQYILGKTTKCCLTKMATAQAVVFEILKVWLTFDSFYLWFSLFFR